jgi:hypothetical protein
LVPKMQACLRRGHGGSPARDGRRRSAPPRRAARAVHRRGRRHPGAPGVETKMRKAYSTAEENLVRTQEAATPSP